MGNRSVRLFNSGGNYNNSSYGLASFNSVYARSSTYAFLGFRSASPPRQMRRTYRVRRQSNGV